MRLSPRFSIGIAASILVLSGAALASIPGPATFPTPKLAIEVLRRYLSHGDREQMSAVVVRRVTAGQPLNMRIKIDQDPQGRKRMIVLHPLSAQGQVAIDDGALLKSFCPDSRRFMVVPSPRFDLGDAELRLQLARANYRLAVEKNVSIAGRPAYIVVAVPHAKGMPTRKIGVDAVRDVLLRVEAIYPGGTREVLYDTKAIEFPSHVSNATFTFEPMGSVRTMKFDPPQRITTVDQGSRLAGFKPILPKKPSLGFVARGADVGGEPNSRYIALRMTDGIVSATLYQWNAKSDRLPLGPNQDGLDRTLDGVRLRLIGEISPNVRERILESIANERGKTFRPRQEPSKVLRTLRQTKEPVQTALNEEAAVMAPAPDPDVREVIGQKMTVSIPHK